MRRVIELLGAWLVVGRLAAGGARAAVVKALGLGVVVAAGGLALAPAAAGFPTTGVQKLLVIPVEYAHGPCPTQTEPSCPRNTAAQLQTVIQDALKAYYGNPATGSRTSFQVRVLADPKTSTGWWKAPSTVAQLEQRAKANKNWNAFTVSGSPVRDAAEGILTNALTRGLITAKEVAGFTRLATIHNWSTFGGQSSGSNPLPYVASVGANGTFTPVPLNVTAAWVNQAGSDAVMNAVLQHELGHELGPGDFYGQPCPLWPPGEPAPNAGDDTTLAVRTECMFSWDLMGLTGTRNPALMTFTRTQLGWARSVAPDVRTEPAEFSGAFDIGSLEYPVAGKPLALHIPDDQGRLVLARAFGQSGYFQGFFAECRRTPSDDPIRAHGQGLVLSYVDSTRSERPIVIARAFDDAVARQDVRWAELVPGQSFTSLGRGFNIRYEGANPDGSCRVFLNRPSLSAKAATLVPAVPRNDPTSVRALGGSVPKAVYANPGLVVGGPALPRPRRAAASAAASRAFASGLIARKARRVVPIAPRRATTIRFAYGNAGGAAVEGEAIVRVQQPWIPQATCGAEAPPAGRVVARVRLPSIAAGAAGVGTARWTPRSAAPAAVSVTLKGAGGPEAEAETVSTVVAFSTLRAARRGARPSARLRLTLAASRRCRGRVPYLVAPAIVPQRWGATVSGTSPLRPGGRAAVTIVLRGPRRTGRAASAIPLTVRFGSGARAGEEGAPAESGAAFAPVAAPELDGEVTGVDVLTRIAARGGAPPSFVLPAAAGLAPQPQPTGTVAAPAPFEDGLKPPGPPPAPSPQALTLTGCSAVVPADPVKVTVEGTIEPARAGVAVKLTYTSAGGLVPAGTVVEREAASNAAGAYSDVFDRQGSAWSVTASVAAGGGFAAATSGACSVPIP